MANARCSTDKPIPHRLCSTATVNSASHASAVSAPIYQRKEKATEDERRTPTSSSATRPIMSMLRIYFLPQMYDSGHAAANSNWMEGAPGWLPKVMMNPTTVVGNRYSYTCPHGCRTSSSSSPTSVTSCTGGTSCGTLPAADENDIQGHGELEHGNWITGIPFFDNARMGNQDKLPDELKYNKGHNVFYCLPLLLVTVGLFWQALPRQARHSEQFWVVFLLFFMTGFGPS